MKTLRMKKLYQTEELPPSAQNISRDPQRLPGHHFLTQINQENHAHTKPFITENY